MFKKGDRVRIVSATDTDICDMTRYIGKRAQVICDPLPEDEGLFRVRFYNNRKAEFFQEEMELDQPSA